jgi:CheY-like chemotaxis protein
MQDVNEVEILLVEDNAHDAELTLRGLRQRNLANRLHHVKDGAEALDFIFARGAYSDRQVENCPKVVLLDLKLPKVDGLEVLAKIRADERTKMTPVVVLTSSTEETDLVRSYELGVNSYLAKPVDFDKFADVVASLGMYWLLLNRAPR